MPIRPTEKKISIMLEEIEHPYKITLVELKKGDQFNSKFRSISPFSKNTRDNGP